MLKVARLRLAGAIQNGWNGGAVPGYFLGLFAGWVLCVWGSATLCPLLSWVVFLLTPAWFQCWYENIPNENRWMRGER